jgi:hypothetical protein
MRTYVMTTGVLFGLVTLAHVWRVLVEGLSLGLATDSALDAGVIRSGKSRRRTWRTS